MPTIQVLEGVHCEGHDDLGRAIVHKRGEVFESKSDLTLHNREGFSPKFRRVDAQYPPVSVPQGASPEAQATAKPIPQPPVSQATKAGSLEAMSLKQLVEYAEENEIDLNLPQGKAPKLEEVRATIKRAKGI